MFIRTIWLGGFPLRARELAGAASTIGIYLPTRQTWMQFGLGWPAGTVLNDALADGGTTLIGGCAGAAGHRQATVWKVAHPTDNVGQGVALGEAGDDSCVARIVNMADGVVAVG